jgi:hypothetical protein
MENAKVDFRLNSTDCRSIAFIAHKFVARFSLNPFTLIIQESSLNKSACVLPSGLSRFKSDREAACICLRALKEIRISLRIFSAQRKYEANAGLRHGKPDY